MFKSFTKYVEEKGLVGEPKVKLVADYEGDSEKYPQDSSKEKPAPYKTPTGNIDPNSKREKDGFADLGDAKLVYEPDTKNVKNPDSWTKTEQFIRKTSKMSPSKFANYMLKEHCNFCGSDEHIPKVSAFMAEPFHPHPPEAIEFLVALCKKNEKIVELLVHAIKRAGIAKSFIAKLLDHPESFDHLSDLMGGDNGEKIADSFARALNKGLQSESVGPPQGLNHDDEDHEDHDSEEDGDSDEDGEEDSEDSDDHDDYENDEEDSGEEDHDNDSEEDDGDDSDEDSDEENHDEEETEEPRQSTQQMPQPQEKSGRNNILKAMRAFMHK